MQSAAGKLPSVAASFNLDQATEESGSTADVGQPVRGKHVRAAAVLGKFVPPHGGGADDAFRDDAIHLGGCDQAAAIVEGADTIAIVNAADGRVGRVHLHNSGLPMDVRAEAEG